MPQLSDLFHRHEHAVAEGHAGAASPLGLADRDGADRWPKDYSPAPDPATRDADLWTDLDPARPGSTPG